jgi:outer membrane protein OmpA-like peptidoglycan-associated protein
MDIWVSEKDPDGEWGEPVNCGDIINTPFNEDTPFFDESENALIFSSDGHISMGSYDIFRAVRRYESWTNPIGMPFAFNNTSSNTFFILNNNAPGFITSMYNEKTNSRNIYTLVALDPADKVTIANGTINLEDGMLPDPKLISIMLTDLKKGSQIKNIDLTDSNSFRAELKPGDYSIFISHPGYKTDTINLNIPLYFAGNYIAVNSNLIPLKIIEREFISINNILFEFDSYVLNSQAISALEKLKSILLSYPELKIEIAGYTDSKGSSNYNLLLANKRAMSVIKYLTVEGISGSRLIKKAYGESNFVAINTNRDGTDNPEGRKYNRRVTIGIIDPQTGITISQESYVPQHLIQPYSLRYNIILAKSPEPLPSDHFRSLKINEMLSIRSLKIDSISLYYIGHFYNRNDAYKFLSYARERGFVNSYIVTQSEINTGAKNLISPDNTSGRSGREIIYTIQLKAARQKINLNSFKDLDGVREIASPDGYYRYVYGEFRSLDKAREAVVSANKSGYKDAFIRDLYLLLH